MNRLICFSLVVLSNVGYSQEIIKEFYDKRGVKVEEENSYYYEVGMKRRYLSENTMTERFVYVDTVISYYSKSGTIKAREFYVKGELQGPYTEFYENGKLKEKGIYIDDRKVGQVKRWYSDGDIQMVSQHLDDPGVVSQLTLIDFKIIDYWDSVGNQLVVNGEGMCRCNFSNEDRSIVEVGNVREGLRDSTWLGWRHDTLVFRENYQKGAFGGGIRFENGIQIPYNSIQSMAEYNGGFQEMTRFIMNNLRYPVESRRKKKQGTVFVQFDVDKYGKLSNVESVKSPDPNLEKEAIRVVKEMNPWTPSKQRGNPVKTRFILPIKFKLGY